MNPAECGLLVLLSILWGSAFFFVGVAVVELPPLTVALVRVGLASMMLLGLMLILGHSLPRSLSGWIPFLVMGLLNNALPFSFLNTGQTLISVGLASIINGMTPLFTALVMASFREERLTLRRVAGVLLGVVGIMLISLQDMAAGDARLLGIGLCLAGALSYGFAALWGRRHLMDVPPLKTATCQLLSSTLIMAAVVALVESPWTLPMPGMQTWLALIALALFGTALAYVVFFEILARAGASNVMLVTLLIPVTALLLGNLFLAEPIFVHEIAGAAVIGLGLLFIDGRLPRKLANAARLRRWRD
ncbi:MAG: DMT family transporter [Gammaproteobacteria bacterium]|nr:DMT family transporter [Gammaproteobacteria bacterium]MYD75514.1 DMT family transporter [Gammaproteobacteria bacterium]MYJ52377.1 DMT family transporter [Gammaproteobacteria bacterium]